MKKINSSNSNTKVFQIDNTYFPINSLKMSIYGNKVELSNIHNNSIVLTKMDYTDIQVNGVVESDINSTITSINNIIFK